MSVRQAELLLAAVIAARAISFMFSKILVGTMDPFNILAVRFLIAASLLAVIFRKRLAAINRSALFHGSVIGAAFFATMAFEMHALQGASSSTVSLLENTAVVFVPLVTAILSRKLPKASMAIACVVALVGVGLLAADGAGGADTPMGLAFGLGSGLAYTCAIIVTAHHSRVDDPIVLGVVQIAVMGLLSLGASVAFENPVLPSTSEQWGSIALLVIVCTGFGFTLQPLAQSRLSADTAGLFCALSPFVATVLGFVFLAEPLTPARVLGMCLIIGAMVVASIPYEKLRVRFREGIGAKAHMRNGSDGLA